MRGIVVSILIFVCAIALSGTSRSDEKSKKDESDLLSSFVEQKVPSNKRVLILYTHRQMSPINTQWHAGIMEAIRRDYHGPIDIDIEYMDIVLQDDRDYFTDWTSLLAHKCRKFPPDVVVPVFFPAFTFSIVNRTTFPSSCPIVFCAVPQTFAASQSQRPSITGVGFSIDFRESVRVIRQVLPRTSRLIVLSGKSALDDWFRRSAIRNIKEVMPDLELVDLWGVSPEEASAVLSEDRPNTAAMLLTFELDNLNNRYTTNEYLEAIKDSSKIPIFGCYDTLLGKGIVGGLLVSPVEQGKLAGGLVARILSGESADKIPEILDKFHTPMFDAELLRRYGIADSRLPPGSKVVNRKPTVWGQYWRYLAVGVAALLLQSAIIVSLLINRKKRIAAEREAHSLAGRILSAGEDERRYLARELHDDVSQRLAAVSIETGTLENKMPESSEAKSSLGKLKRTLKSICDDLHRMSRHMHPSVLDDFGLPDALKSECKELTQRWSIPIEFHHTKDFPEIPKSIALCVYRVAQESLWNAIRHSGATKITAELKSDPEFVYWDIRDDGIGFDPHVTKPNRSLGLASMTERIRLVGGTIKVQTAPTQGVAIAVVVPIPESNDPFSPRRDPHESNQSVDCR